MLSVVFENLFYDKNEFIITELLHSGRKVKENGV